MNFRRLLFTLGVVTILFSCKEPVPRPVIRIIPLPAEVTDHEGLFALSNSTKIEISSESDQMRQLASFLTVHTEKYYGFSNTVVTSETGDKESVFLKLDENLKLGKEH